MKGKLEYEFANLMMSDGRSVVAAFLLWGVDRDTGHGPSWWRPAEEREEFVQSRLPFFSWLDSEHV